MAEKESVRSHRRTIVSMSFHTGMFIDAVSRYTGKKKADIYQMIWQQGVAALFDIEEQDLERCALASIPPDTPIPQDLKALTNLICGE